MTFSIVLLLVGIHFLTCKVYLTTLDIELVDTNVYFLFILSTKIIATSSQSVSEGLMESKPVSPEEAKGHADPEEYPVS